LYEANELYRRYWLLQSLEEQQPPAPIQSAAGG
jgi:hypothetical protein